MPFNPNSIAFYYKKGSTNPTQDFELQAAYPLDSAARVTRKPNWLNVIIIGQQNASTIVLRATLNTNYADQLTEGDHNFDVEFTYGVEISFNNYREIKENLPFTVTIENTVNLELSPTNINFNYTIGGAIPIDAFLNISTERAWTAVKDGSWLNLNKTQGNASDRLTLGVNVSGLAVGEYSSTILVDDGKDKKTATVILRVQGLDTNQDYLTVAPATVDFIEGLNEAPTSSRQITVESSSAYTINSTASWLSFSANNGAAGITNFTINTFNTENLAAGNYTATVVVTSNHSSKSINVYLLINETGLAGVDSDGFYFQEDRDFLQLAANNNNTVLVLDYSIVTDLGSKSLPKKVPFFNGFAKTLVADMADNLVVNKELFLNQKTRVFIPVDPITATINVYDKPLNSTTQTLRGTFSNIKMLTGKTPLTNPNYLSYMPNQITATLDACLAFSFRASNPPTEIQITGAVNTVKAISNITADVYTCFVNLSEYDLKEGDLITIFCGGFFVRVSLIGVAAETTYLCWLNEWSCPEFFTAYGHRTDYKETEKTTTQYALEGKRETRVLEVRKPYSYKVNSGFLFSNKEYQWLSTILDAKKIWLSKNGKDWIKVICKNSDLQVYKTRSYFNSYMLNFENAEI